jgi:hypothetical protein
MTIDKSVGRKGYVGTLIDTNSPDISTRHEVPTATVNVTEECNVV